VSESALRKNQKNESSPVAAALNEPLTMTPIVEQSLVFSGEYRHALDPKKRITIPASWRRNEAGGDELFLMEGQAGSFLKAMPPERFGQVAKALSEQPDIPARDRAVFLRHFYSKAVRGVIDKAGRLVLPEAMVRKLGLEGDVVLVGAHDTFEVWSPTAWQSACEQEASTVSRIADLLGL
jgi:MraZ protein